MVFENLLSEQGRIAIILGTDLMGRRIGDRIPTVQEYAERCNTSVGTVQKAQAFLQEQDMLKLQARGRQGTYLVDLNLQRLWPLVHPSDLLGMMPLPYSARYEGLATALNETLERAGIALNLAFTRGATRRLRALAERRCDFVVLSGFAAAAAQEGGNAITPVLRLGPESYVSEHVLVFREAGHDAIVDGMRVGIDPQSVDQAHLTRQACAGKQVTQVEISYMQLPAALQRGLIDATVWNRDELNRYPDLYTASRPHEAEATAANTEACVVALSDATYLIALLKACLDVEQLRRIQAEVMFGERLPGY